MNSYRLAGVLLAITLMAGCTQSLKLPDLGGIYERAAQSHDDVGNPVIVIPGVLRSRLVEDSTGRVVWGAFADDYANPERPDGARLASRHPRRRGQAARG